MEADPPGGWGSGEVVKNAHIKDSGLHTDLPPNFRVKNSHKAAQRAPAVALQEKHEYRRYSSRTP